MAKKNKHKAGPKHSQQLSVPEMLKQAEEQLRQGRTEQPLLLLRQAENALKPRATPDGKKISTPPHLIAAQAELPGLMARALLAHARLQADPKQQLALLEEAVRRVPDDARYLTALGAFRLSQGDAQTALSDFQKAGELAPNDNFVARGLALSLLAIGRSREAVELLDKRSVDFEYDGEMNAEIALDHAKTVQSLQLRKCPFQQPRFARAGWADQRQQAHIGAAQ